ncbi:transposase [Thalassotalea agarivorans]|uniref:Putative transposase n=1 Tax=Thalassotalea agarivorans TaxID=349064 RepID=A0A1H9Y2W5_THASX|nr:putative transposase [Thalassotalea agarivorans]
MGRPKRNIVAGVPQHIIIRGINKQSCFCENTDFRLYLHRLRINAKELGVAIHAWVLMTNHVHLLCTAPDSRAISKMMQKQNVKYTHYFNKKYERTGTLWEGRFKSIAVEDEFYLFELYRYIEMNPVRAKMVRSPADYAWSSYLINIGEIHSELCTPHVLFQRLCDDTTERTKFYKNYVIERENVWDVHR